MMTVRKQLFTAITLLLSLGIGVKSNKFDSSDSIQIEDGDTPSSSRDGFIIEWHIPYSCQHHGFVCEMLGYLPALQQILGEDYVEVTGLGKCSEETLNQFAPKERLALETALAVAQRGKTPQRFCRMTTTASGSMEQVCDLQQFSERFETSGNETHDKQNLNQQDHHSSSIDKVNMKRVVISHGDPCAIRHKSQFKDASYVIGRTMTEGKLSDRQFKCLESAELDELWLPSPWQVEVFENSSLGYPLKLVHVRKKEEEVVRMDTLKEEVNKEEEYHTATPSPYSKEDSSSSSVLSSPILVYIPETVDGEYYSRSRIYEEVDLQDMQAINSPKRLWNYSSPKAYSRRQKEEQEEQTPSPKHIGSVKESSDHLSDDSANQLIDESKVKDIHKQEGHFRKQPHFSVISVFKWGYRKGWDVLLEGYWRAFTDFKLPESLMNCMTKEEVLKWDPCKEVVLKLRTSKPEIGATKLVFESRAGRSDASEGISGEVREFGRHFISSYRQALKQQLKHKKQAEEINAGLNLDKDESKYKSKELSSLNGKSNQESIKLQDDIIQWLIHLPPVDVFEAPLSRAALRMLVGEADLFALPSRGEGWGLPITEAMALEVPVTSTFHAGPTLYLTTNNSFPLLPGKVSQEDGSAEPSVIELRDIIRNQYIEWKLGQLCHDEMKKDDDTSDLNQCGCGRSQLSTQAKAKQAREDVIYKFSPEEVASMMCKRLEAALYPRT